MGKKDKFRENSFRLFSKYDWCVIPAVFIIAVMSFFILYKENFNFEKDVCDEWSRCDVGYKFSKGICIGGDTGYIPQSIGISGFREGDQTAHGNDCLKFHTKSKCELNPSDAFCVCENFSYSISAIPDYCVIGCKHFSQGKVGEVEIGITLCDNNITIKDLPECHPESKKVCLKSHEKTLYDFNCSELRKHIFLEDYFCLKDGKFTSFEINDSSECMTSLSTIKPLEIKKIYVDKGCEV